MSISSINESYSSNSIFFEALMQQQQQTQQISNYSTGSTSSDSVSISSEAMEMYKAMQAEKQALLAEEGTKDAQSTDSESSFFSSIANEEQAVEKPKGGGGKGGGKKDDDDDDDDDDYTDWYEELIENKYDENDEKNVLVSEFLEDLI